jgi:hypothetical protein
MGDESSDGRATVSGSDTRSSGKGPRCIGCGSLDHSSTLCSAAWLVRGADRLALETSPFVMSIMGPPDTHMLLASLSTFALCAALDRILRNLALQVCPGLTPPF